MKRTKWVLLLAALGVSLVPLGASAKVNEFATFKLSVIGPHKLVAGTVGKWMIRIHDTSNVAMTPGQTRMLLPKGTKLMTGSTNPHYVLTLKLGQHMAVWPYRTVRAQITRTFVARVKTAQRTKGQSDFCPIAFVFMKNTLADEESQRPCPVYAEE